jgi:uncharacterized membrane protein (DUF485 family)
LDDTAAAVDEVNELDLASAALTRSRVPPGAVASSAASHLAAEQQIAENGPVKVTSRQLLESTEFRQLVARRWRVALALTCALFVVYYGFILLVATQRRLLATRVGEVTTLGIVLGVAVLLLAWVLTATYVVWANRQYDPAARRLRDRLRS